MKIAFVCIGDPFTVSMLYKENYMIRAAVEDGHDVIVIASDLEWHEGKRRRLPVPRVSIEHGYKLFRIPFRKMGPRRVTEKLRYAPTLRKILLAHEPNIVYFNTAQLPGIKLAKQLKARNSQTRIVCHFTTTYDNSGRNFISLRIQHGMLYRRWLKVALPYIDELFYAAPESLAFLCQVYAIPAHRLSFLPLPGEVFPVESRRLSRKQFRDRHDFTDTEIVYLHAGKFDAGKQTVQLLESFHDAKDPDFRLVLAGTLSPSIEASASRIIELDPRIIHLGFLSGAELVKSICGSDVYLQPGTVSQTAQTAICCGLPVVVGNHPIYRDLCKDNAFLVESAASLTHIFRAISQDRHVLESMSTHSFYVAENHLDFRMLFRRVALADAVEGP
ncbi:Glycosyl transferases group 1 [Nocardioides dokdonensis FR1436]|uniref:Glycosyl transferases group 1 n=1 Tax=Nocardioides dokdonensis FR1436 TaxID=1300347 RepID=A0A1A9GIW1_9ACTN|nr:glycosyltransferase [Nocardioides dokdonensis]ANH38198.1 Glycosyl transferases group 1 [Nocardioides dokdonensis FR1436]